jgi:hypothetical protein
VIGTDGHIYLPIQSVSFFTGDLMVSDDGGATFEAGTGLAPGSYVNSVAQAQSDPKTAYASVYFPGALMSPSLIYVTHDGGKTWAQVSDPVAQTTYETSTFTTGTVGGLRLAVDPQNAKDVWTWDLANALHSTDGGATWKVIKLPGASPNWSVNALNIFHPAGKPAQILLALGGSAATYTTNAIYRSDDGGLSWYQLLPPSVGRVWAFGHGPTPDSIVGFSVAIQGTHHQYAWAFDAKLYRSGHFPWRSIGYDLDGMQMETLAFGQSFGLHPHYFLFGYQAIERH